MNNLYLPTILLRIIVEMGRYAFFSTGFEYKFGFGVQPSSDIRCFGGVVCTSPAQYECGYFGHSWNMEKDGEEILYLLTKEADEESGVLPKFSEFPKDLSGTNLLWRWLYDNRQMIHKGISMQIDTFKLGCLIYHQLLYTPDLIARYEG